MVKAPARRSFLEPRVPGPIPTPEEVDFGFHLLPEPGIPTGKKSPKALYIADVLKKIRKKYVPGEPRRQLRRDYESKLGRRMNTAGWEAMHASTALDVVDEYDPDEYFEMMKGNSKEDFNNYQAFIQKEKALLEKAEKVAWDKTWKVMDDASLIEWARDNPGAQKELMRRKAVRAMQLVGRDDIPRRGLLKMAASQLPVVKQGQQVLGMAEKSAPTLVKALKAILSRKFRSM